MVRPGRTSPKPGSFSTRKVVIDLWGAVPSGCPSSLRTSTATRFDEPPFVSHIFWPFRTYSSPSLTAFEVMAETSEPRAGSDIENAPRTSPRAIRGRKWSFCSCVPCCLSMYATMKCVLMMPETDIQPRAISSTQSA